MTLRTHSISKSLASLLIVAVVCTSVFAFYPINKAQAQAGTADVLGACGVNAALSAASAAAGELLNKVSLSVPTVNRPQQLTTITYGVQQCLMAIMNLTIKVALARLKKRLLDRMADQTIAWISGEGGKPKFVTNFNDEFKGTLDAALGDVLIASGAGKLCSDRLSLQLQTSLRKQKKFSEQITCTLSGAAKNVTAFEKSFKSGGWIGYGELMEPSNNRWGLELLAQNALNTKQEDQIQAKKQELASNQGYQATKYCNVWTLQGVYKTEDSMKFKEIARVPAEKLQGGLRAPDAPPDANALLQMSSGQLASFKDLLPDDFPQSYTALSYACKAEDQKTSTPGMVIANAANNAMTIDWNSIASADDLTPYISSIFDAAVNRLKKEGVKGLQRASNDIFSNKTPQTISAAADAAFLKGNADVIKGVQDGVNGSSNDVKSAFTAVKLEASSTRALLAGAKTQNTKALTELSALIVCQKTVVSTADPLTHFEGCPNASAKLATLTQAATQLAALSSSMSDVTALIAQTETQINAGSANLATVATLSSLVADLKGRVASIASETQKIIDATTPDANLITAEGLRCHLAQSTPRYSAPNQSAYSCPIW